MNILKMNIFTLVDIAGGSFKKGADSAFSIPQIVLWELRGKEDWIFNLCRKIKPVHENIMMCN